MMNRIITKLKENKKVLSIYFTAGFPSLDDTETIIESLAKNSVDMIEIGLPLSDPVADGPTIQYSSTKALKNGMNTEKLFEQLKNIRGKVDIPLLIMGYLNPILQYGVEKFCTKCDEIGIDGCIIPDLPIEEYETLYKPLFKKNNLLNVFFITPQTSKKRIEFIDEISEGFVYVVSSAGVTGGKNTFSAEQEKYLKEIADLNLKTPQIVGFGISNKETFEKATANTNGAIIGSAFIKHLENKGVKATPKFISKIKNK